MLRQAHNGLPTQILAGAVRNVVQNERKRTPIGDVLEVRHDPRLGRSRVVRDHYQYARDIGFRIQRLDRPHGADRVVGAGPDEQRNPALAAHPAADPHDIAAFRWAQRRRLRGGPQRDDPGRSLVDHGVREEFQLGSGELTVVRERSDERDENS